MTATNGRIVVKDEDMNRVEEKYVGVVEQKLRLADMISAMMQEALTQRVIEVEKAKDDFRKTIEVVAKEYNVPDEHDSGVVWELSRAESCFVRQIVEPKAAPTVKGTAIEIISE